MTENTSHEKREDVKKIKCDDVIYQRDDGHIQWNSFTVDAVQKHSETSLQYQI